MCSSSIFIFFARRLTSPEGRVGSLCPSEWLSIFQSLNHSTGSSMAMKYHIESQLQMICLGPLDYSLRSISWVGVEGDCDQLVMSAMRGGWGCGGACAVYLPTGISEDLGPGLSFDDPIFSYNEPFLPYKLPRKAHFQCSFGIDFWNLFIFIWCEV